MARDIENSPNKLFFPCANSLWRPRAVDDSPGRPETFLTRKSRIYLARAMKREWDATVLSLEKMHFILAARTRKITLLHKHSNTLGVTGELQLCAKTFSPPISDWIMMWVKYERTRCSWEDLSQLPSTLEFSLGFPFNTFKAIFPFFQSEKRALTGVSAREGEESSLREVPTPITLSLEQQKHLYFHTMTSFHHQLCWATYTLARRKN